MGEMRRWAALMVVVAAMMSGCGTSVKIASRPHGAEVIMDQERVLGKTPILLYEQAWLWTSHTLTARKQGYLTQTVQLEAGGSAGNLLVCLCLWPMWAIALQGAYPESVVIELRRARSAQLGGVGMGAPITFQGD